MKTIKEKYPIEAKELRQATILILISMLMMLLIPILVLTDIIGSISYLSFFVFYYILKKQCIIYEGIKYYIQLMEEPDDLDLKNKKSCK
jgi:hypothetical protein